MVSGFLPSVSATTPVDGDARQQIAAGCEVVMSSPNILRLDDRGTNPALRLDPVLDPVIPPTPPPSTIYERRVRVSIEGAIGVGKSTVLEALRAHFAGDKTVCFVSEPVDAWISSGLLGRMYDKTISGLSFQVIAAATRFGPLARLFHDSSLAVFITERSLGSDAVFASVNLDPTTEWPDYELAAKQLQEAMPTDVKEVTVYLDAPDEEVMARIQRRQRDEEKAISMDYLARIRKAHEAFYESIEHEKVRVNASRNAVQVAAEVAAIVEYVRFSAPLLGAPGRMGQTAVKGAEGVEDTTHTPAEMATEARASKFNLSAVVHMGRRECQRESWRCKFADAGS